MSEFGRTKSLDKIVSFDKITGRNALQTASLEKRMFEIMALALAQVVAAKSPGAVHRLVKARWQAARLVASCSSIGSGGDSGAIAP